MNEVYETDTFTEIFESSDESEQEWINKIKDQLYHSLDVGKVLKYDWFREKKLKSKRLFFIINNKTKKALLIAFGTKQEQQKIINHIIANKDRYLRFID